MTITLTDLTTTTARTSIAFGNPAKVNATIKNGTTPLVGVVVTFTTDTSLATFTPATGTALTDANGVASINLSAASFSVAGAGTVSAAASVASTATPVALSQSIGYSVGAANVTISPVSIQSSTLSAFGTTGLSVTVSSGGQPSAVPLEVKFTSPCALSGKAALTSSATTVNGVASATYRDIGCAAADTITATITGTTLSSTGVVTVAAPAVGSIQFVSAQPTSIALRGTGGVGRQETSLVTFKVVDVGGNPIGGRVVQFALNTSVGGLSLTPSSATSDATGLAVTTVSAGTVSTPVRVTASTTSAGQTLSTQSDQLSVSTGVPSQGGFSLSVSTPNIEGGDIDGTATQITARLADRFSNPVPNGTVVNFTSAGGSIGSTCTTVGGVCSTTLTSQNFRPTNGRVAILAYAIGEESFTDKNGNGWFDISPVTELVDLNGNSTDLPEAWLDVNENRVRDATEPFVDFNNNAAYDGGDGKFNGVSCNEAITGGSAAGSCSAQKSIHVRGRATVVFSSSSAKISSNAPSDRVSFATCGTGQFTKPAPQQVVFTVRDQNDNVMPAGTTVSFTTTNGTITSLPTSFTVPNSNVGPSSNASGVITFAVSVESDARQFGSGTADLPYVCTNTRTSGDLRITVKAPSGLETTATVRIDD
ncbi:hypothetical protein AEM42_03450 [Betaproteobacteria bacterium UKL13-2]|nr:hypothetical protein AEM42_03450 [Betaproteobacteria bacterium UKL13-2]HCG54526.1 hypothetical protein [Betaproteobacteria bacterium]